VRDLKNDFIYKFKSVIKLNIKGKNIERFIRKIINKKIELLNITYPSRNEVNIKIYKDDYEKIKEIKTIYDIYVVDTYGMIKIKKVIDINRILILFLILGISFLIFLSNIIFKIEIVHTNKDLRTLISKELEVNGIKKNSFKKNFSKLQEIKESIITKHKDKIEWLEIEIVGTKYVIRVQERKLPIIEDDDVNRHVVASRSAIIRSVEAQSGMILKQINDYVRPGDVIISGEIKLNDATKQVTKAEGVVFGEVWYETKVEYPLVYKEEKITGKKKKVLVLQFLNRKIELFNFKSFKYKKSEEVVLLENSWLPIKLIWDNQKEVKLIEEFNTEDEAINKATLLARKKMESKLNDKEYIINQNCLKVNIRNSTIEVEMFFAIHENITSYQKIEEIIPEESLE
jgi:similar to stage IV sporulation protein